MGTKIATRRFLVSQSQLIAGTRTKGEIIYAAATLLFCEHRIRLHRMGDRCEAIHLAKTPPAATGRSAASPSHPAQFPLYRVGISRSRGRVTRAAICLRVCRCLRGLYCRDTRVALADMAATRGGD